MRKGLVWVAVIVASAGLAFAGTPKNIFKPESINENGDHHGKTLIEFDTMYGVDGPFVDVPFPGTDLPGDELPWTVRSAHGRVDTDGHVTIKVQGLVFTDDPEVPPDIQGTNDEPTFRAAVSCTTEEDEAIAQKLVVSQPFKATPTGNSTIKTTLDLPNPCIAPVVFILAGSEDKWFAVNGFEDEGEGGGGENEQGANRGH